MLPVGKFIPNVGPRSGPGWLRSFLPPPRYRLVFGAHDAKRRAVNSSLHASDAGGLNHRVEVSDGIMAEDCARLLRAFFQQRRNQSEKKRPLFSGRPFSALRCFSAYALRRAIPISPRRPEPKSQTAAGTGTALAAGTGTALNSARTSMSS